MRIVSLLPSATEIVCELGLGSNLVGISHECDFPSYIAHLARLTTSRVDCQQPSTSVHQSVQELIRNSISIYDLNLELLKSIQPDVVITQDICDVCAVSFDQVERACREHLGAGTKLITLRPQRLGDIWKDVERVADTFGRGASFQVFEKDVRKRVHHIQETIQSAAVPKRKVITIEWIDPVMIGGLWVPEMIDIAGGDYLLAVAGQNAVTVDKDQLRQVEPDVVVIKPCGFKLDQTLRELDILRETIPWESWKLFQTRDVFLVDGNAYFNRPGPRIIDSLELLAYCIHPNLFSEFEEKYSQGFVRIGPRLELPAG